MSGQYPQQAPDGRRHTTGQNIPSNISPGGGSPTPSGKKPNDKSKSESFREWLSSTSGWATVIVSVVTLLLAGSAVVVKVVILTPGPAPSSTQAPPSQISTSSSNGSSPLAANSGGQTTSSPQVTTAPVSQAVVPSTSVPLASNSPAPTGAGAAGGSGEIAFCTYGRNTCLYYPYNRYYTAQLPDAVLRVNVGKFPGGTVYIFKTSLLGWNSATSTSEGVYEVGATDTEQVSDITLGAVYYGGTSQGTYTCLNFKVNASGAIIHIQLQGGVWTEVPNSCM